jgi:hypothetical protein
MTTTNSSTPPPPISSISSIPSTPVMISPWEQQIIEKVESIFLSHTNQKPRQSSESLFAQGVHQSAQQFGTTDKKILHLSNLFISLSMWSLAQLKDTDNAEAKRQYGLFVNHLQSAENCMVKAIQIHNKDGIQNNPVTPSQRVTSLPLSL